MSMLTLKYLGHCSFEFITSKCVHIIIDPYKNSLFSHWFKCKFPRLSADLLLITHNHFDHNAINRIKDNPLILNKACIKHGENYLIKGIKGRHAKSKEYNFYENIIFLLEFDGIRFCHWGDNDAELSGKLRKQLGRIDVLMLPVDESEHLLTLLEVSKLIKQLNPKIIIPMHYFDSMISSCFSPLKPIEKWLSNKENVKVMSAKGINIRSLPKKQEIWVFNKFNR